MSIEELRKSLKNNNLKITPQRLAVLEALSELNNHPTAENIIQFVKEHHPNIAIGTVYNILDAFFEKGIVKRIRNKLYIIFQVLS